MTFDKALDELPGSSAHDVRVVLRDYFHTYFTPKEERELEGIYLQDGTYSVLD